jgi:hypothetical protein
MSAPCAKCGHKEPPPPCHQCVNCDVTLKRVFDDTGTQYEGALGIHLLGGYGMYFDNIDGDRLAFLCRECADKACKTLPWIQEALSRPGRRWP